MSLVGTFPPPPCVSSLVSITESVFLTSLSNLFAPLFLMLPTQQTAAQKSTHHHRLIGLNLQKSTILEVFNKRQLLSLYSVKAFTRSLYSEYCPFLIYMRHNGSIIQVFLDVAGLRVVFEICCNQPDKLWPFCQVVCNLGNEEESTPISVSLSEYVELDGFESTWENKHSCYISIRFLQMNKRTVKHHSR